MSGGSVIVHMSRVGRVSCIRFVIRMFALREVERAAKCGGLPRFRSLSLSASSKQQVTSFTGTPSQESSVDAIYRAEERQAFENSFHIVDIFVLDDLVRFVELKTRENLDGDIREGVINVPRC